MVITRTLGIGRAVLLGIGFTARAQTSETATTSTVPADYNIDSPSLVRDNIAKSVDVKVLLVCSQLP